MEELQEQIDQIVDKSINDMKIKIAKVVNRHLSRMVKEQSRNVNSIKKSVNVSSKQPVVKNVRKSRGDRERGDRERDDEDDSDV
jgi:hypothetical protein